MMCPDMFGHFNSNLLMGTGLLPPGNENVNRPPQSRFVLHETDNWPPLPRLPDHRERLRFCFPDAARVPARTADSRAMPTELYVLEERRENGK